MGSDAEHQPTLSPIGAKVRGNSPVLGGWEGAKLNGLERESATPAPLCFSSVHQGEVQNAQQ
jgi:hypothetical protein